MSGIRAPGTVTTVTILCTDVVDSAEIRNRLGEEPAERLLAGHRRLLRDMAREQGSMFFRTQGQETMAVFPSATAGLEAIIAIEQALVRENRKTQVATERIKIRAALSAGDVRWGKVDIAGLPPVEAARLLAVTDSDQVLCTDVVRLLSQGRCRCEFAEHGLVHGKGLSEPMHVYELMWRGAGAG